MHCEDHSAPLTPVSGLKRGLAQAWKAKGKMNTSSRNCNEDFPSQMINDSNTIGFLIRTCTLRLSCSFSVQLLFSRPLCYALFQLSVAYWRKSQAQVSISVAVCLMVHNILCTSVVVCLVLRSCNHFLGYCILALLASGLLEPCVGFAYMVSWVDSYASSLFLQLFISVVWLPLVQASCRLATCLNLAPCCCQYQVGHRSLLPLT